MKKCSRCKESLARSRFNANRATKDSLDNLCRECRHTVYGDYYRRNRDKVIAKVQTYRKENLDVNLNAVRRYRAKDPDTYRVMARLSQQRRRARLRQNQSDGVSTD